jgi:hypothetical protein
MFEYRVLLPDQEASMGVSGELVSKNVEAALEAWSSVLVGRGVLIVEIKVEPTGEGRLEAASRTSRRVTGQVDGADGLPVCEDSALYKLRTGHSLVATDAFIRIPPNSSYIRDTVWFDENPGREQPKIPPGLTDAVSLFMHELAHCFGMVSFRNPATGEPDKGKLSVFDTKIERSPDGAFWFVGPNAQHVYGNPVPLTFACESVSANRRESVSANLCHYGNRSDRHELIFERLMYGPVFSDKKRHDISPLDVAIMRDLGLETVTSSQ